MSELIRLIQKEFFNVQDIASLNDIKKFNEFIVNVKGFEAMVSKLEEKKKSAVLA